VAAEVEHKHLGAGLAVEARGEGGEVRAVTGDAVQHDDGQAGVVAEHPGMKAHAIAHGERAGRGFAGALLRGGRRRLGKAWRGGEAESEGRGANREVEAGHEGLR
jgi:hypothetical protein